MGKKTLPGYTWIGQGKTNGCAYAVVNQIINYYNNYKEKRGIGRVDPLPEEDNMDSVINILFEEGLIEKLGLGEDIGSDKYTIMSFDEIVDLIYHDNPIVSLVGVDPPNKKRQQQTRYEAVNDYEGGHWVAIIGYDDGKNQILVSDPDPEVGKHWINYGELYCEPNVYFQNSTAIQIGSPGKYFKD